MSRTPTASQRAAGGPRAHSGAGLLLLALFLLAAAGLALLAIAADQLVIGASRAATRLRISPIVVGVVIIGLGTSAPELVVAGLAAARDEVSLALASLVGSNIVNVTLILGVAALIAPIAISSATAKREAPMSVVAVALLALAAWWGLGLGAGLLLTVITVIAIALLVWAARRTGDPAPAVVAALTERPIRPIRESLRVAFGLAGTIGGAQLLVLSASEIAEGFGVAPEIIGFTLVAIGTSLPELVTAIQSQRRGEPDLVVGNLLGSNLFNSVAGGAVVALAAGPEPAYRLLPALLVVMVGISALAWLLLWLNYRASRRDAVILIVIYLACLPLLA